MTTARSYTFDIYDENAKLIRRDIDTFAETVQAKRHAGKLCKQHGGPVDLAFDDDNRSWDEKYIATVEPSTHHTAGYLTMRLEA